MILICTVGTSLFESNLRKLDEKIRNENDKNKKNFLFQIKDSFENKNWNNLAKLMQNLDPKDRLCGAEINTIEETLAKKNLNINKIFFMVSDTDDGKNTGLLLKKYYQLRKDLNFNDDDIQYFVIEDLQDQEPKKFKLNGLRNLVRKIGEIARNYGKENIIIDATGGYKAQIAIAVIIGQALNISVFYKHEKFSEIIDFVPLPVSLDYDLLGKYADLFWDFENNDVICEEELENFEKGTKERLSLFLDEVSIDGRNCYALNPLGSLYLESFKLRYPKGVDLYELNENEREGIHLCDHHYPDGYEKFVNKVYDENKWIKKIISIDYSKQKSIKKGVNFYVIHNDSEKLLVGSYKDRNNFGARFRIFLSNESVVNLNWAANFLNEKYKKLFL